MRIIPLTTHTVALFDRPQADDVPPQFYRVVEIATEDDIQYLGNILFRTPAFSIDTETTGLYSFKGDKLFAVVFAIDDMAYYVDVRNLPEKAAAKFASLLGDILQNKEKSLLGFNLKFDLHFIRKFIRRCGYVTPPVACRLVDGKTLCRLENNNHMSYSLADCAERDDLHKDHRVDRYIVENRLFSLVDVPGKSVKQKIPHFDKVPPDMMRDYAAIDAIVTYKLCKKKINELYAIDPESTKVGKVLSNECGLLLNVADMERAGLKIDKKFIDDACSHEVVRDIAARVEFKTLTGADYMSSPVLFSKVFESERANWKFTEKGNPSFDYDTLSTFTHPAAKCVLQIRDSKSRQDFLNGFIYYADANGIVHPNLDPSGTATGRFSSSQPNFQNLTNEEEDTKEGFLIRRAIIPREIGRSFLSIDYSQQEYRLMLDYAGEMDLIDAIMGGADVHQATADMMGVSRREAKMLNFMLLYGGGAQKLADSLKIDLSAARELKGLYFSRLPNVQKFIELAINTAKTRGYVFNWLGRRLQFPDKEFAYKAPNALIQGGGADIMKVAINNVAQYLVDEKISSTMYPVLTVHDELILEGPHDLIMRHANAIKTTMEKSYPHKNIPMACSIAWSSKSLAEPDMSTDFKNAG